MKKERKKKGRLINSLDLIYLNLIIEKDDHNNIN